MVEENLPFDLASGSIRPLRQDFSGMSEAEIVAYVTDWFGYLFCDPVEETPYIDGEYHYVYGGPYDPRDVIYDYFSHLIDESVIEKAVEEITSDGLWEFAPTSMHPDQIAIADEYYAEQEYQDWLKSGDAHAQFLTAKGELDAFFHSEVANTEKILLKRMVFMQAWSILEAYLAGRMIKAVKDSPAAISNLYKRHPDLRDLNFKAKNFAEDPDLLTTTALSYLSRKSYHALDQVFHLYSYAFGPLEEAGVSVSEEMNVLCALVSKRHDCVHRNGRTTDDEEVKIQEDDILVVLNEGAKLVEKYEELVRHHFSNLSTSNDGES